MHALNGGLVALFGWGVVFVILAAVAAGIELLAPWIETMTWGRGLGIGLAGDQPARPARCLGRPQRRLRRPPRGGRAGALAGTAGSILVLVAVLLGSLVLAFDVSVRETVGALRERYLSARRKRSRFRK